MTMTEKLHLTVAESFSDGNLKAAFEAEGYPLFWRKGFVRNISTDLARRVKQSGGVLTTPEPSDPPDPGLVNTPRPVQPSMQQLIAWNREKNKTAQFVRVITPLGFSDGTDPFRAAFGALDRPPWLGKHEIIEMPVYLLEMCERGGGEFSTDETLLEQFSGQYQVRYQHSLAAWRAEILAEQKAREARSRLDSYNAKYLEQIEIVSAKFVHATAPRTKQALGEQLEELWSKVR